MKKILVLLFFIFAILPVSAAAQMHQTPSIGSYPQYGDGFLYLVDGGYAELADSNVSDIDYTTTSFSVEAIVDSRISETTTDWNTILRKGGRYVLWDSSVPGWGLGFYRSNSKTVSYALYAKVGDGAEHAEFNYYFNGMAHIVMNWDHTTKNLELFVNGVLVENETNANIVLSNIDNTDNLVMSYALGDTKRNILMIRWWGRKLSGSDVTNLYNNWAQDGDDRIPGSVSTTGIVSEWLMNEESASDGSGGTGYVKDNRGSNHLQMIGNVQFVVSNGEPLTMIYPGDGATGIDKSVTLKADGGDADIPGAVHPLLYFFQVDIVNTFNSPDLRESGWISHYAEYRPILDVSTTYYWRVKVRDINGQESPYSPTRSFTTEPASSWYVRPVGGNYGSEDGTSYDNAWDGLHDVFFNESGVEPGDDLYICGLHYHTVTSGGAITQQGDIIVRSGATEESPYRITIRGDCPNNPGIVWNSYKIDFGSWNDEGGGVYSIDLPGTEYPGNYFQDIGTPNDDSYILLNRANDITECRANPGSFFKNDSRKVYIHTTYSGDPTGRIWGNRWGYDFNIHGSKYITFYNLTFFTPKFSCSRYADGSTHLRWEKSRLWYGESMIFPFYDGNHYMEILDCDIGYSGTPIYIISGTNNAPSNYVFARNTIHDCGTLAWHRGGDNHAFGIQGGNNGMVEDNYIYHCRDGIVYYLYGGMDCMNNTIRRNYIRDIYKYGYMPNGISFGCSNVLLGNTSGNRVYDNIIINVTRAMYFKWPDEMEVYNNLIVDAEWAFNFGGSDQGRYGAKVKLRNNIAYNISQYYMRINGIPSIPDNYGINSDYNIFYPVSGKQFVHVQDMNLSEWLAQNISGHTFDPNTIIADPLFIDRPGRNFHLQPTSPAIDAGVFVGLTEDYEGNPIPQGNGTDIGAYEFASGTCIIQGDLNIDCKVNLLDLQIITMDFGRTGGYDQRADTILNGEIDIFDVVYVASRFT